MAASGSGGAYYRASAIGSSFGLHNANTIHFFVRASAVPSTANVRAAASLVGGVQNPHEQIFWNNTNASFYKARGHRRLSGTYVSAQIAATPAANTWHSLATTFDGTNARIYLNGVLEGTSAASAASDSANVFLDFLATLTTAGAVADSSQFDIGQGAELALWNVALTADECASLGKGFRASRIRPQSLLRYTPFIRDLNDIRSGETYVKQAGTDVFTDHPRVIG